LLQELKVEASRWQATGNPMIQAANIISQAMENLQNTTTSQV
jgi:hypothetical protein